MKFTDKPQEFEVDKKTLAVLKAEPLLIVEELPEAPEAPEPPKGGKK